VTTVLAFLFVLGVLIFVHEFGHFIVARLHGVRVLRFSLGFDPKIVKFVRGGTEYSIGLIPLGGFVKLAGETIEDKLEGKPDEFLSKSKWVRFQVYLAGPVMNVLLALVLLTITISRGVDVPLYESAPAVVGKVAPDSPAQKAGIVAGDQVTRVDDRNVKTWNDLDFTVMGAANREMPIRVLRGGTPMDLRITPAAVTKFEVGTIGIQPVIRPQLVTIEPSGPAEKAGLQRGDVILAVDGKTLDQPEIIDRIRQSTGKPLVFTIERGDTRREISVTPEKNGDVGRIGVAVNPFEVKRIDPSLGQAVAMSAKKNWESARAIYDTLRGLVRGRTPMKQLMGPLRIAQLSGSAAQLGWIYLFELMAMISLNLGLINLLPVPIMDGGQIAILGFEGLIRRDLSLRVKERILLAGAALIVVLMGTVIYNDVVQILK
jgi:regulator of sigma E protease